MEGKLSSLKEVDEFRVTDRPFVEDPRAGVESYSKIFHLDDSWIGNLPKGAIVLNVGSGIYRTFEKQIKQAREDIRFVSIDPTLSINFERDPDGWYIEDYSDELLYKSSDKPKTQDSKYKIPLNHAEFQKRRISKATEVPGAIVAFAPHLPIRDNSVDVFFDTFGANAYLEDEEKSKQYLTSLHSILKKNGVGYLNYVSQDRLEFLQSFPDVEIDVIEVEQMPKLKVNYYKLKLTKMI